jgi:hypothetical protein
MILTSVGCSMDSSGRQTGRIESVSQQFSCVSLIKQSQVPPEGLDPKFYQLDTHALLSFRFPERQNQTKVGQSPARSHWHEGWHAGVECYFRYSGKKKKLMEDIFRGFKKRKLSPSIVIKRNHFTFP